MKVNLREARYILFLCASLLFLSCLRFSMSFEVIQSDEVSYTSSQEVNFEEFSFSSKKSEKQIIENFSSDFVDLGLSLPEIFRYISFPRYNWKPDVIILYPHLIYSLGDLPPPAVLFS